MRESELWWRIAEYYERAIAARAEVVPLELSDALRQECIRSLATFVMLCAMRARYNAHISLMTTSNSWAYMDRPCSWPIATIEPGALERRMGVRVIAATLLALECEEEERR